MSVVSFVILAICAAASVVKGDEFQEATYKISLNPGFSPFFTKDTLDAHVSSKTMGDVQIIDSNLEKDIYTVHMREKVLSSSWKAAYSGVSVS